MSVQINVIKRHEPSLRAINSKNVHGTTEKGTVVSISKHHFFTDSQSVFHGFTMTDSRFVITDSHTVLRIRH